MSIILNEGQGELFFVQVLTKKLEALRKETAGRPLAGSFLDFLIQAVFKGYRGEEALENAANEALSERAANGVRQVEEHYLRKSRQRRAIGVRERIDSAISQSNMKEIAKSLIGVDATERSRAPVKKTGIDEGVRLL